MHVVGLRLPQLAAPQSWQTDKIQSKSNPYSIFGDNSVVGRCRQGSP